MKSLFSHPISEEGLAPSSRIDLILLTPLGLCWKLPHQKDQLRQILFIGLFFCINMKTGTDPDSHVTIKEITNISLP